ncbi:signal transduction histidine kinase, nitrogen specific, NtrB [Spirochaeta thermophila DSM 6578]|uniref:histidine kinase n=1 Tax=Winmispira thermophila (strain ATCC 700085 / DSM 6578 / Z-1203) TaxID=869211 RepID=G0G9U5_WINT7|nr:ATP-binding protein [Spirochaeta thermophila]AEJ60845.1 signal transduction histidine kinase, nitrogen specific, NtrB [Spirochaeta thermophila DSM 6578]
MRGFLERTLGKLEKLDREQLKRVFEDFVEEYGRLEDVLNSIPEAILVLDEDDRLAFANRLAQRLGVVEEDSEGRGVEDAVRDTQIREHVRALLSREETVRGREFTFDLGGRRRIFRVDVLPLVRGGMIRGTLVLMEDVTDQRAQEVRLKRMESLASLTTLAASVAHEIKNPLGAISIHLQLIERLLSQKGCLSTEEVSPYVGVIKEEIERLNRIVVDFLFAVRPINLEREELSVRELVEETLSLVGPELAQAGVRVDIRIPEDIPSLSLDRRYIKQALLNLIKNAVQAMPEGGVLTVWAQLRDGRLALSFSDTGVGIPEHLKEKIFEPYFTTKETGSGLGLTLVYKIVQEHGGEIEVQSAEGKGTTFTLLFPIPATVSRRITWNGEQP